MGARAAMADSSLKHASCRCCWTGENREQLCRSIKAFVRDVVGFDPFFAADQLGVANVQKMSLESLFETSDIISLHLPLSEKPIISSLLRGSL